MANNPPWLAIDALRFPDCRTPHPDHDEIRREFRIRLHQIGAGLDIGQMRIVDILSALGKTCTHFKERMPKAIVRIELADIYLKCGLVVRANGELKSNAY